MELHKAVIVDMKSYDITEEKAEQIKAQLVQQREANNG